MTGETGRNIDQILGQLIDLFECSEDFVYSG